MIRIKRLVTTIGVLFAVFAPATSVGAVEVFEVCNTPGASDSAVCQEKDRPVQLGGPNGVLAKVIDVLSFVIGFAGVLIMVWGGQNYITANGDGQKAARAKDTILFAVIGLAIAASAQLISIFIIKRAGS